VARCSSHARGKVREEGTTMNEQDWDELEEPAPPAEHELEAFPLDEEQEPPPDALDEIEALAAAEADELATAQRALAVEREHTREALARYRDAVLAAEPDLPPELVRGDSLEELERSLVAARSAVAEIRTRLTEASASVERGFPVGAPARGRASTAGLSAAEKIRRGLEERSRA
jgi:hypothetical protein